MWRGLPIVIRRRVRQRAGYRKQSVLASGRGFHIHGVRALEMGDPPRAMSRKHYVRTGAELVIEKYAERNAFVLVLLDVSASGLVGAEALKLEAYLSLLNCLARACLWQGNLVKVVAFTDRTEHETPVLSNPDSLEETLAVLRALGPLSPGTGHREPIEYASAIAGRNTQPADLVCIISDMLFPEPRDAFLRDLTELNDLSDVVVLVMRDRVDMEMPPLRGALRVRDIETGEAFLAGSVSQDDPVSELYEHGVDACVLMTSQSEEEWFEALSDFFSSRLREGQP